MTSENTPTKGGIEEPKTPKNEIVSPFKNPLHMSRTSPVITEKIMSSVRESLKFDEVTEWNVIEELPQYTLTLPDLNVFPDHVQDFMRKDLIETNHMNGLARADPVIINWHSELSFIQPLKTEGDGNCLLHAVSLGMWGVHDRDLLLRNALYETMAGSNSHMFKERWMMEQTLYDSESLDNLWNAMVEESRPIVNTNEFGKEQFSFLEQMHIFVLAHILRRPIIVYAESVARHMVSVYELPIADRIDGIYLPLCCPRESCREDPLALSFFHSHFSPLVGTRTEGTDETVTLYPLVDANRKPLPIRFLTQEEKLDSGTLENWIGTQYTPSMIYCARQVAGQPSLFTTSLIDEYLRVIESEAEEHAILEAMKPKIVLTNCSGGCGFMGSSETDGYCSRCYRRVVLGETDHSNVVPSKCRGGCGFHGSSEKNGYCTMCYKKFGNAPPVNIPHFNLGNDSPSFGNDCRGGCGFSGTEERNGYCSVCFKQFQNEIPHIPVTSPMEEDVMIPCKANGCSFMGSLQKQGFCSVCHKKFVLGEGMGPQNNDPYTAWW